MREPQRSRQLRLLSVTIAALLLATISACGGGSKAVPGSADTARDQAPQSLQDALRLIREEEAAAKLAKLGKQPLALPDTVQGDGEWFAGPPSGFTEDNVAHTMRLQSTDINPDNPNNLAYSIYRLQNHALDQVGELNLSLSYTAGQYWVYVVDYAGTASWHQFGPYTAAPGGPGWPLDLSGITPISAADRVYVAIVTAGVADVTVGSLTIQETTPPPPQYYETEPNDTFDTADALPPFDFNLADVTGHVGGADAADWYSFDVTTAGRVYLTLVLPDTTGDLDFRLYDTDGTTLLDTSAGTEAAERMDFDIASTGTYFVKVTPFGGASGDYQLWGTYADTGENVMFEIEGNNAPGQANAMPPAPFPDPSVIGSESPGDINDYYSFQSVDQFVATITMYTDRDNPAQRLELIGSDGSTIIASDNVGGAFYQVRAAIQAGTYYVHVQEITGSFDYELRADLAPFDPSNYYEVEPNNNAASANPLPPFNFAAVDVTGDVGEGGLNDGSADDWFSFTVAEEGTAKFMLSRSFGVGDPYIELVDSDGTTRLANSVTGYLPESISYYFPQAGGPYYLHLACSNFTWCSYGVTGLFHPGVAGYFETEDNDTFQTANPLPAMPFSGNAVTGNLGMHGDYNQDEDDWYSFTVGAAGSLNVTVYLDSIGGDIDMTLMDTDGTSELDKSNTIGPVENIQFDLPEAGTYFIHTYIYNHNDSTSYSMDASFL